MKAINKEYDSLVSNGKLLAKMLSSFGKLSCTETLQSDEDYASFADQWFKENADNPILSEGIHHLTDYCETQAPEEEKLVLNKHNYNRLLQISKERTRINKVEEGLKFTPTDGEYEGIWHEVDYLIGGKGTVWDCKYKGKDGMNWAFDEADILRWINDANY